MGLFSITFTPLTASVKWWPTFKIETPSPNKSMDMNGDLKELCFQPHPNVRGLWVQVERMTHRQCDSAYVRQVLSHEGYIQFIFFERISAHRVSSIFIVTWALYSEVSLCTIWDMIWRGYYDTKKSHKSKMWIHHGYDNNKNNKIMCVSSFSIYDMDL